MARKSLPSNAKSHNGYSADEFQRQLLNWFQDRGLLSDLQAHLRHQMIVALRDTSLNINSAGSFHQAGSPKLQAINLLVAEFLLRQECHYTLSVFTSEVPLLRNLPEFSNALNNGGTVATSGSDERFPGFHERDVFDILEALGFGPNTEETRRINDLYEHSHGESLLTCVLRTLPDKFQASVKATSEKSHSPEPRNKEEQLAILQQTPLFTEEFQNLILEIDVGSQQLAQLHNALKRIIEEEVGKVQKEEQRKFRSMLVDREQHVQGIWKQYDEKIQEKLVKAEEKLKEKQSRLNKEISQKQAHLAILASQLREQQNEVANRLNYVQERNELLEQKEVELRILKKESEECILKERQKLEGKEKQIEQQLLRLDVETQAREKERRELEANRIQIEQASKAIRESQSEIAMLRDLQKQHNLSFKALQEEYKASQHRPEPPRRKKSEWSSQAVQVNLHHKPRGAIPKVHNVQQQTSQVPCEDQALQTQISGSDMDEVFMHLRAQSSENERRRSQHTMMNNMIDHLEQENLELRGHIGQQRLRIEELTLQSSRLMHHLNEVNASLTRLRSQQSADQETGHQGAQASPVTPRGAGLTSPTRQNGTATAAAAAPTVNATPVTPPPPPIHPQPIPVQGYRTPFRGFVRSNQLGAGEESYFSRRLPPDSYIPFYSSPHREHRRKPLRRLMVHSFSSSEESSPSPTEDMLQEARRRLRRLEEETAAVDRNYQEFRLRQVDSLTNTASILFQPVSSEYSGGSGSQNTFARPMAQKVSSSLPSSLSKSRFAGPQVTLVSQVPSVNIVPPSAGNTAYVYSSRISDQARQVNVDQLQGRTAFNPQSQFLQERSSNAWGRSIPSMAQSTTLGSRIPLNAHSGVRSPRDAMNLPAAFNFNAPHKHQVKKKEVYPTNQPGLGSSRLQELPPCVVSVPHIPVSVLDSGTVVNQRSQLREDKSRTPQFSDGNAIAPRTSVLQDPPSSNYASLQFEVIKEVPGKRVLDNVGFRSPFQDLMYSKSNVESHPLRDSGETGREVNDTKIDEASDKNIERVPTSNIEGLSGEQKECIKDVANEDKAVADVVSEHSTGDSVVSLTEGERKAEESRAISLKQDPEGEVGKNAVLTGGDDPAIQCPRGSLPIEPVEETLAESDPVQGEVSTSRHQRLVGSEEIGGTLKSSEEVINSLLVGEIISTSKTNENDDSDVKSRSALKIGSKEQEEIACNTILMSSSESVENEQINRGNQTMDNVKENSKSPSSPSSILGSSNEVSSDVISAGSAGQEKSDNSW